MEFAIISPSHAALRTGSRGAAPSGQRWPQIQAQAGSSHGWCIFCPPCGPVKAELLFLYPWTLVVSGKVGQKVLGCDFISPRLLQGSCISDGFYSHDFNSE